MKCTTCGSPGSIEDNFCRRCGTSQRNSRLPVKRAAAQPPAVWQQAAPAVVRGAALIAAGVAVEWLMRVATKRAFSISLGAAKRPPKSQALALQHDDQRPSQNGVAISETVVMRRVILRR